MNKIKLTIKDSATAFLSGFLFMQLASILLFFVALVILKSFGYTENDLTLFFNTAGGYLVSTIVIDVTLFFVFFFLNKHKENKINVKPKLNKLLIYSLIGILTFFCMYPFIVCVDSLLTKLGIQLNTLSYELTTKNYLISIISLVILPPIAEELLFRGFILKGLQPYGKVFSIVLSSLMFALFHMSIDQFVYPMLFGLILGVIMYNENNILYCIVVHAINNFLSLTLSYLNINLIFNHWSYILLAFVLLAIFLAFIIVWIYKTKQKQEKIKANSTENMIFWIVFVIMIVIWLTVCIVRFI